MIDKKQLQGLDFEISFYEDLIKDKPDFIDALILLGGVYTKKGLYKKGLNVDKRLVKLLPSDPVAIYNLACSYSLVGDIDSSIKTLVKAINSGYNDLDFMNKDPDLKHIRDDKRFKQLIKRLHEIRGGGINGVWFVKEEVHKGQEKTEEASKKKTRFKKEGTKKSKAAKKKNP